MIYVFNKKMLLLLIVIAATIQGSEQPIGSNDLVGDVLMPGISFGLRRMQILPSLENPRPSTESIDQVINLPGRYRDAVQRGIVPENDALARYIAEEIPHIVLHRGLHELAPTESQKKKQKDFKFMGEILKKFFSSNMRSLSEQEGDQLVCWLHDAFDLLQKSPEIQMNRVALLSPAERTFLAQVSDRHAELVDRYIKQEIQRRNSSLEEQLKKELEENPYLDGFMLTPASKRW